MKTRLGRAPAKISFNPLKKLNLLKKMDFHFLASGFRFLVPEFHFLVPDLQILALDFHFLASGSSGHASFGHLFELGLAPCVERIRAEPLRLAGTLDDVGDAPARGFAVVRRPAAGDAGALASREKGAVVRLRRRDRWKEARERRGRRPGGSGSAGGPGRTQAVAPGEADRARWRRIGAPAHRRGIRRSTRRAAGESPRPTKTTPAQGRSGYQSSVFGSAMPRPSHRTAGGSNRVEWTKKGIAIAAAPARRLAKAGASMNGSARRLATRCSGGCRTRCPRRERRRGCRRSPAQPRRRRWRAGARKRAGSGGRAGRAPAKRRPAQETCTRRRARRAASAAKRAASAGPAG